ncbi:hypothetical protein ACRAWF_16890 [Streptomyces sp. L7]
MTQGEATSHYGPGQPPPAHVLVCGCGLAEHTISATRRPRPGDIGQGLP